MRDRLLDPFGRTRLPGDFSREGRIALINEVAQALLDGRTPTREGALFVGAALGTWLREGGRCGALERDFLRVAAPPRSTLTAGRMFQRMQAAEGSACRATPEVDVDTMPGIDDEPSTES